MRILVCSSATNKVNRYLTDSIYRALCHRLDAADVVIREQGDLAASARLLRPDLLLVVDGQEANTPQIRRALEYASSSAIWFFEDPYELPSNIVSAAPFDQIFSVDRDSIATYPGRAIFLPLAADPEACLHKCQLAWHHDITFIGSAWPNRINDLLNLHDRFPNVRWNVRLLNNPTLFPILERDGLAAEVRRRGWLLTDESLGVRDVAAIFNRSRITLSLPRHFSAALGERHTRSASLPPRVFETAMAGSYQLVSKENWDNANPLFPAETIGVYSDLESASDLIELALKDAQRVGRSAKRAQAHAACFHSFDSRATQILDAMNCAEFQHAHRRSKSSKTNGSPLILVHNRVGRGLFGGVEVFAEGLYRSLPSEDCFIAFPEGYGKYAIDSRAHGRLTSVRATPELFGDYIPRDETVELWLERFALEQNIRVVYVTHIINWPLSILDRFESLGIEIFIWLNDFFYMCQSINLLSREGIYCKMPILGTHGCDPCLKEKFNAPRGHFARRKAIMGHYLQLATALIAPSRSTQILYESTNPEIKHNIVVQPYFVETRRPADRRPTEGRLSVLVAGNLSFHKGAGDIISVISGTKADDIVFHICGQAMPPYERQLRALAISRGGVTIHGSYMPGDLPAAFFECDVALFLSVWPETYLIALDEAISAGCVPIVTNSGAPADRVFPGINGFKVDVGDSESVIQILVGLAKNRDSLSGLRDAGILVAPSSEKDVAARIHGMTDWTTPLRSVPIQATMRHLSTEALGLGPLSGRTVGPDDIADGHSILLPGQKWSRSSFYLHKFIDAWRHEGVVAALRKAGSHVVRHIL